MKKFLSLVMALVMTMSLVTVSAGAKDFTDDSKINYEEAVAVMSELGVVGGYADGSFNPSATLTRGAAAKIICNLILGTTAASALVADAAPYSDVPTSNVFSGYIAYCAKEGIISGYADGTFRPANTLTGYAFMKMLLGALGLDSEVEGYTGANWSIAVAKRALSDSVDLTDGLKGEFNGVNAVTREEACLYAFNMIKAGKFTYPTSSTIVVGDVTVKNNSVASQDPVTGANFTNAYFQKVFSKLVGKSNDEDAMGRPATTWKYNGKTIGTYAHEADATYTAKVKEKDLWKDIDANGSSCAFDYWVDGVQGANYTVSKTSSTKLGGNGMITEVYYDYDGVSVTEAVIVCTKIYYGEIDDVDTNDDDERIVTVNGLDYVTEEFAEDDKVMYTIDSDAASDEQIQTMVALEKLTGEYTKVKGDDVTIDGKVYTMNCNGTNAASVKDDVDFYLDANGYVIYMETSDEEADLSNLAYVINAGSTRGNYAELRLADGSKKIVDTNKNYGVAPNNLVGKIVTFKDSTDGVKLTDKSGSTISASAETVSFKKGVPTFEYDSVKYKTDAKTGFVYAVDDGSDTDYKLYTGYKNAPSISGSSKAVLYVKDGVVVLVYIEMNNSIVTTSAADMTFVAYDDGADLVNDGDNTYYELNAVVDGKITSVMVDATVYGTVASTAGADEKVAAFKGLTYNSDDIATGSTAADAKTVVGTQTKAVKNETIWVDGVALSYTDDVKVFFVDGCDFSEAKISSIREDNDGTKNPYKQVVYNLDDDGVVEIIFLVKN